MSPPASRAVVIELSPTPREFLLPGLAAVALFHGTIGESLATVQYLKLPNLLLLGALPLLHQLQQL